MTNDRQAGSRPADRPPQGAHWELPDYAHGRELGAGASGRVVLAHHRATGTPVAIKYLLGDHPDQAAFRGEAELLATLDSPHVTRLYEYVESPHGAAIVMEPVEGISLRDLLRAEGETGPEAALVVLKGSLLGLAAAHRAGVVHRDYKPGNVLVTAEGESKLVDFGIAVRTGDSGAIAGTPAYMAPEQWAGQPASPATDVYAATATFFECLTGAKPYAGTTLMELAVQHTEADIPDTQAPEALRPLIRAGLAKDPEQRPDGAEALVGQLEEAAGAAYGEDWEERGRRRLAALVALLPLLLPSGGTQAAGGTSYANTVLAPPAPPTPRPRLRLRAPLIAAVGAFILLSGGIAAVASTGDAATVADPGPAAAPLATTSLLAPAPTASSAAAPPPATDSPTPTASDTTSPSPSPGEDTPSPSNSPTKASTPPKATATAGSPTTAPGTPPPTPTATVAPPIVVVLGTPSLKGGSTAVSATVPVTVRTTGSGTATLTFTWYDADDPSGRPVGTTRSDPIPAGSTRVTSTFTYSCRSWNVKLVVSSAPAAAAPATAGPYSLFCLR